MSGSLQHAAQVIRSGGIVAYATEHCFGFGCDPWNGRAVERLLRIKHRSSDKGLILIAADAEQLTPFVIEIPERAARTWPGPYTWLLEPRPHLPRWISGRNPRIAVRITAHSQAARLCRTAGRAIVSTSANRTGRRPARGYREALRRFGASIDYVLPGRVGDLGAPTSIRDGATGEVVRP
ncbi:MAG TPA: L-threonylcarbamoyladenylate synthase [Burkholderiales bacterium]